MSATDRVEHCPQQNRYRVHFHDGGTGELVYHRDGDVLRLIHSEVPSNRRGAGLGARLMVGALTQIQADQLKVQPVCSYTQHFIARRPEWHSLLG